MLHGVLPRFALGHGSMVIPPPRNLVDSDGPPWSQASRGPAMLSQMQALSQQLCYAPPTSGANITVSQACFWFSAGCAIGCKQCDGATRGPIPNVPCANPPKPGQLCAKKEPVCDDGLKAPRLPKEARTVNTDVEDGAVNDWYQYSPWRAPGTAGYADPCGVAGGGLRTPGGAYDIEYKETKHVKPGDVGSSLSRRETGTVWRAGDVVEVSWTLNANHGGGYYYRLCKLPSDGNPVTEACFQQTPLRFVGNSRFRWNGNRSSEEEIESVFVSEGTHPPGSQWAMNPVPRNDTGWTGASFAPKCKETCTGCTLGFAASCATCRCTGVWGGVGGKNDPANSIEIVDNIALPWMLPAGDYVVGWRWDAEEANQVWGNCADITVVQHPDYTAAEAAAATKESTAHGARTAFGEAIPCPLPPAQCLHRASGAKANAKARGEAPPAFQHLGECFKTRNSYRYTSRESFSHNVDSRSTPSHLRPAHVPLNATLAYVRKLMQQAVEVEHSTIPLYLSALWSLNSSTSDVATLIHGVGALQSEP